MEPENDPNAKMREFRCATQEALDKLSVSLGVEIDANLTLKVKMPQWNTQVAIPLRGVPQTALFSEETGETPDEAAAPA